MIQIIGRKERICSVLTCDVCGLTIKDIDGAMLALPAMHGIDPANPDFTPGRVIPHKHAHKKCLYVIEEECEAAGLDCGHFELRDHIWALLMNLGWTNAQARRAKEACELDLA